MNQRTGEIHVHGTHVGIWEENVDEPAMREVFAAFRAHLEARGFVLAPDPRMVAQLQASEADYRRRKKKRPKWLAPLHARLLEEHVVGKKGDLELEAETAGRTIKVEFFQNVANVSNPNGGRYDFDKLARMPRHLRLACIVEMVQAIRFFDGLGYTAGKNLRALAHKPLPLAVAQIAEEKLERDFTPLQRFNWGWGADRFPRDETGWPAASEFNAYGHKDRDGAPMRPGDERCFYHYSGRLMKGRVYPNMNGMWTVHLADGSYLSNESSGYLFTLTDQTPRRRALTPSERVDRLRKALRQTKNPQRLEAIAKVIERLSKPRGQLHYVLSLKHTKASDGLLTWWGPGCSGYVFRLEDAGLYDASDVAKHGFNEHESTRAIPCEAVHALAVPVSEVESREIDSDRSPADLVVLYKHLRALRGSGEGSAKPAQAMQEGATA